MIWLRVHVYITTNLHGLCIVPFLPSITLMVQGIQKQKKQGTMRTEYGT